MDRYVVFLSDKDHTTFDVNNPELFLSARAIDRRERMGIDITTQDLPVDTSYISQVSATGADVYFQSKWLNALLVQMFASEVADVEALSFVDSVVYVAKGERLAPPSQTETIASVFKPPVRVSASTGTQLRLLGSDDMHEDGYRGEGMLIAVFDDGFEGVNEYEPFGHIYEDNRLLATKDFIANSGNVYQYDDHGSSVLSCIASDYTEDLVGTAPEASFLLCVTEDLSTEYRIEEYNWLMAAEFADSAGVDVINGSLGYSTFSDPSMNYSVDDLDGETTIVARAAKMASDRGIVVVVSAGNSGNDSWGYVTSPGDAFDILTVGSIRTSGERSGFSSFGPTADGRIKPDVVALGSSAAIFFMSGEEGVVASGNGTSFASPQVAGFVAGVMQKYSNWTSQQVIESIRATGNRSTMPDTLLGYGIPKYPLKSFDNVLSVYTSDAFSVYPNPLIQDVMTINFGDMLFVRPINISMFDSQGREVFSRKVDPPDLQSKFDIELSDLRSGIYFLSLRSKKFKKVIQLRKI